MDERWRGWLKRGEPYLSWWLVVLRRSPCGFCGRPSRPTRTNTVEHVRPRSRGGSDRDTNLGTSCRECNKRRGTMGVVTFMYRQQRWRSSRAPGPERP